MKMKMKTSLLAPVCGIAVLATSLSTGSAQAATYKSANGYSFTPPAGWQKLPNFSGTEIMYRSSTGENINVLSRAVPAGITLAQIRAATIPQLRAKMTGYQLVGQGNTRLGGVPAAYIYSSYLMGTPPQRMRGDQIFVLRKGRMFAFTCTSRSAVHAKYKPIFQKILNSVRWTK